MELQEAAQVTDKAWVAYYAPMRADDEPDPSEYFDTEDEAWDYVFSRMCDACKGERRRALAGGGQDERIPPSRFPACACEWFVLPKEKYDQAGSFFDILEGAGWAEMDEDQKQELREAARRSP